MTTIAFKDNILAADTLATSGGYRCGYHPKAFRVGRLRIGGAGISAYVYAFRHWVIDGMKGDHPLKTDEGNLFIIKPDGSTVCWSNAGPFLMDGPWALGSGENLALGAMLAGATAEEAVRHAMTIDTCSGGDVTVLGPTADVIRFPTRSPLTVNAGLLRHFKRHPATPA